MKAEITIENLPSLLAEKGVEECAEIYKELFGVSKLNHYSMTLFSGTIMPKPTHFCKRLYYCDFHRYRDCLVPYKYYCNPNILYMGDFDPKNNIADFERYYSIFLKRIAIIQVPHHGSKNNYDPKLYEYPIVGIVSVGNNNSHHHPDIDTMAKIEKQECHPIFVTEDIHSRKIYYYVIV